MQALTISLAVVLCGVLFVSGKHLAKISWGESEELMERSREALKCEKGEFAGMEIMIENFLPIVLDCQTTIEMSDINKMSLCFMEKLGLVDSDGAPNVPKMDAFIQIIFSKRLLQDLPTFPEKVHICAEEYAMNYNGILKESQEEGTTTFLSCIKSTALKFHDIVHDVCQFEEKSQQ